MKLEGMVYVGSDWEASQGLMLVSSALSLTELLLLSSSALPSLMVTCCPGLLQELPNGDPKEGPFWEDKGSLEGESSSSKCSQTSP